MFLKKLFDFFGERKVTPKADTAVGKVGQPTPSTAPLKVDHDLDSDSRTAQGYNQAVHGARLEVDEPFTLAEARNAVIDLESLSASESTIDEIAGEVPFAPLAEDGSRSVVAPRESLEKEWSGTVDDGDVVDIEEDGKDVDEELALLTRDEEFKPTSRKKRSRSNRSDSELRP